MEVIFSKNIGLVRAEKGKAIAVEVCVLTGECVMWRSKYIEEVNSLYEK